jgi:ssDNA-binding Zn-finger/Zn-ribbon topoisomerase 1
MKEKLQNIIFSIVIFFVMISILLTVNYVFYLIYLKRLPKWDYPLRSIEHVDLETMRRLGFVQTRKKSSFVNYPALKRAGKIRIGCFGDSFTYGSEVADDQDYPGMLQRIFHESKMSEYEVINFGNGWHGFHQMHIMWKYIGTKFDLDYVLLGPMGFFYARDSRFNHTYDLSMYYLHSRYIIRRNKLRLVDVIGESKSERVNAYYRFFPHLRYLLYDKRAPAFLNCFASEGRELINPFYYYKGSLEKEMQKIYKKLLEEMLKRNEKIILADYSGNNILKPAEEIDNVNLKSFKPFWPVKFPYICDEHHNSPMGNYVLAKQMFNYITGRENKITILTTQDIENISADYTDTGRLPLSEYAKVSIVIDNVPVGRFTEMQKDSRKKTPREKLDCNSLLAVKNKSKSKLDAYYIPLDFQVNPDDIIEMKVSSGKGHRVYRLGTIELMSKIANIGVIDIPGIVYELDFFKSHDNEKKYGIEGVGYEYKRNKEIDIGIHRKDKIEILLNKTPVLYGKRMNNKIYLYPVKGNFMLIRAYGDKYIDIEEIKKSGKIFMVFEKSDGSMEKTILANWQKKAVVQK